MRAFALPRGRPRVGRRQAEVAGLHVQVAHLKITLECERAAKRVAIDRADALQDRLDEATATIDALLDKEPAR